MILSVVAHKRKEALSYEIRVKILRTSMFRCIAPARKGQPMNLSNSMILLLMISGAATSTLMASGYFLISFVPIVAMILGFLYFDKKERKFEAAIRDRPVY